MPRMSRKQAYENTFNALDVSRGECTAVPAASIPKGFGAQIINYKLVPVDGQKGRGVGVVPVTKPGLTRITNTPLPNSEKCMASVKSPNYTCLASEDNLYYLDGNNDPQLIGAHLADTNSCRPVLLNFAGYVVVLDGGYLKYWDETDFNVLHDVAGYEFNWLSSTSAGTVDLNGTNTKVCQYRTTSDLEGAAFTLPTGPVYASLSTTGSPTGSVYLVILDGSGTPLQSSDAVDVSSIGATAEDVEFTFSTAYSRTSGVDYRYSVEYGDGDASNYLSVHYSTTTSQGLYTYTSGAWGSSDTAKRLIMACQPGLPPKARWGLEYYERLLVCGDPDNSSPSYEGSKLHYSDLPSSTAPSVHGPFYWGSGTLAGAQAGFIGMGRGDGAAITGMGKAFGGIVIFKGPDPAKFYTLTGAGPDTYDRQQRGDGVYCKSGYAVVPAANNLWFVDGMAEQAMDLLGVVSHGDIKYRPLSEAVQNTFETSSLAFAEAYGLDDQVWYYSPGASYINVYHPSLRAWTRYAFGAGDLIWDECNFTWDDWAWGFGDDASITPAGFYASGEDFYLCSDDGHLFRVNQDVMADGVVYSDPILWGRKINLDMPHNEKLAKRMDAVLEARGLTRARGEVAFIVDAEESELHAEAFSVPVHEDITFDDADWTFGYWDWPFAGESALFLRDQVINFNFNMLQVGIVRVGVLSAPLQVGGVFIRYALLGVGG